MGEQRFLDEVRTVMRRQHYSIHTERSYCDWIARYVKFHRMLSREEVVAAGVPQIEAFLSALAEDRKVAASTQNQAFNALIFCNYSPPSATKKSLTRFLAEKIGLLQINLNHPLQAL